MHNTNTNPRHAGRGTDARVDAGARRNGGTSTTGEGDSTFNAPDVERSLIGAVINAPSAIVPVMECGITERDFSSAMCLDAWGAILTVWRRGESWDAVTVGSELERTHGRKAYIFLSECTTSGYAESLAPQYARVLREATIRRGIRDTGDLAVALASDRSVDVFDAYDTITQRLVAAGATNQKGARHIGDVVDKIRSSWDELARTGESVGLVHLPWPELDKHVGALRRKQLVIVAAREKHGKSRWSMQVAAQVAYTGGCVMHFTLEMDEEECVSTLAQMESASDASGVQHYTLNDSRRAAYFDKLEEVRGWKYFVDGDTASSIDDIRLRCIALKAKYGLDCVVIDYTQLVAVTGRADNREQEIARISRGMKRLAKELDVLVIAGSQLNADGQTRESRALQQDADKIVWLFRDVDALGVIGQSTSIALTQRMGSGFGREYGVKLRFDSQTARFVSCDVEAVVEQSQIQPPQQIAAGF